MARSFNGTSEWMDHSAAPVTAKPMTFHCICFTNSGTTEQTNMGIGDQNVNNHSFRTQMASIGSNKFGFVAQDGPGGSGFDIVEQSGTSTVGVRYSVVGWVNATQIGISVDNANTVTAASTRTPTLNLTSIGRAPRNQNAKQWDGEICEVAIWNVELTAAERAALARRISPLLVRRNALVMYVPLLGRTDPEIEIIGARNFTLTGPPPQAPHHRIMYPARPVYAVKTTAAVGDDLITVISDTVEISNNVTTKMDLIRLVDETADIVEDVTTRMHLIRLADLTELMQIVESTANQIDVIRMVDEVVEIGETVASALGKVAVVDETVEILESLATVFGKVAVVDDTVELVEDVTTLLQTLIVVAIDETLEISETFVEQATQIRLVDETVELVEAFVERAIQLRFIDETVEIVESVDPTKALLVVVDEVTEIGQVLVSVLSQPVETFLNVVVETKPVLRAALSAVPVLRNVIKANDDVS